MAGAWLSQLVRKLRRDPPADGSSDAELLARFARDRDEAAFELLVWRHGRMVLSACRRALGREHDAEDAFQATFLVLARKAGGVGRGAALPAWLHRVAVRISVRAARRRRGAEPLVGEVPAAAAPDPVAGAEVAALLDAEIDRLPDRLRRAVVLCYLEGLTAAEAGRRLGCPTGTVESRLAAARRTLRVRLARRGVTTPVGVFAFVGGEAVLAPEAVAALARAGRAFVTGGPLAEVGDGPVRLAKGELAMGVKRLAAGVGVVGLAVAVGAGYGLAYKPTAKPDEPAAKAQPAPPPKPADTKPADPAKAEVWPLARQLPSGPLTAGKLLAVAPDGRSLVLLDTHPDRKSVHAVDLTGRKQVWSVKPPNGAWAAAVSPDGKWLATAEESNGVKLRELPSGKVVEAFWPSGNLPATGVAFTPDGSHLLALCSDGADMPAGPLQLSVWDLAARREVGRPVEQADGKATYTLPGHGRFVLATEAIHSPPKKDANNPNTSYREVIGLRYRLLDPLDPARDRTAKFDLKDIRLRGSEVVSPDGRSVALAVDHDRDGGVLLADLATGRSRPLGRLRRRVELIAFSPDGQYVAAASRNNGVLVSQAATPTEVVIWEAATGREVARLADKERNHDFEVLQFSPDGAVLAAQEADGGLTIWGRPPAAEPAEPAPAEAAPKVAAPGPTPDRFAALLKGLAADGVTDARRVEAVFLAALGRLPTDTEAKALAAQLGRQADKPAAVRDLLDTLVGTAEFKSHAAALGKLAR